MPAISLPGSDVCKHFMAVGANTSLHQAIEEDEEKRKVPDDNRSLAPFLL